MITKKCTKCLQTLEIEMFPKQTRNNDKLDTHCKVCRNIVNKEYRISHKEKYNKLRRVQYLKNKEYILKQKKEYTKKNTNKKAAYDLIYREKNKQKIRESKHQWELKHCNEPLFKIKRNLRRRLLHVLNGEIKQAPTFELIGCSVEELKKHLEDQFDPKMTWNNYGIYWHIDHIIQCQEFDLTQLSEQKECFHYSNLRPLEAKKNVSKLFNKPRTKAIEVVSMLE